MQQIIGRVRQFDERGRVELGQTKKGIRPGVMLSIYQLFGDGAGYLK